MKCSICKEDGHSKIQHVLPCHICGSPVEFLTFAALETEAKQWGGRKYFTCRDEAAHKEIKEAFMHPLNRWNRPQWFRKRGAAR